MEIANNILKYNLRNVYFLVGTACGGKTTLARELSRKYGFIHFNDNWQEENAKVWQTIIEEKYQPKATARSEINWEDYFSRTVDEFLADAKNDIHGDKESLQFSIIELIKLSQNHKVVADVWIDDFEFLSEISDYNRIACLIAPGDLIVRDYYSREDHKEFTECIESLKNPRQKFETQNELFRLGVQEMIDKAEKQGFYILMRTDECAVEDRLRKQEKHFSVNDLI
jgi:adenylate kinase family enzyme